MNSLDSRFLRVGDCYAQKFSKPGTYRYILTSGAGAILGTADAQFSVVVREGPPERKSKSDRPAGGAAADDSRQHTVVVKSSGSTLLAEPPKVEISVGDTVLWYTADPQAPGFAVIGEGDNGSFNSSSLAREAVFTHAFGASGTYRWVDANGGPVHGQIVVVDPTVKERDDYRRWIESLSKGTVIHVIGERAEPPEARVVTGQTVVWAVERAAGISVTDSRLLVRKRS